MMPLPDSFNISLAGFGEKLGVPLALEDGRCIFTVDGTVEVEIDYIEDAHVVVAWAVAGVAPLDGFADARARTLLALNEIDAPNGGFSIAMDPATRRIIVQDHRQAELFDSADRIAAWIDALVNLVVNMREHFAKSYPCGEYADDTESEM